MTKLEEFRDWLYRHREFNIHYGTMEEDAVDEIISYFEDKFSEELYFAQKNVINQRDY